MRKRFQFKFIRSPDSAFPPDRSLPQDSASPLESSVLPFPFPPQESDEESWERSNDFSLPLSIEHVFPPAASSVSSISSFSESASQSIQDAMSSETSLSAARVSRISQIFRHTHKNDAAAVRRLLEEDPMLVHARDIDNQTPLHVASLHSCIEVAKCLIEFGADINAQDPWKNTPLADAERGRKMGTIQLLKSHGGLSYSQNRSRSEPNKRDWEIEPYELDFSKSYIIGKGSFGQILKADWQGTPVAIKRILPNLTDDEVVVMDFRLEVELLVNLRHPNIVQFIGAVTEKKPLMLITEYLRGGDLRNHLRENGALSPSKALNFALDIARGMAYLHNKSNVVHRDLKPSNIFLVNASAEHLKVGDFGLSKLIKVRNRHEIYRMTGETGSYRYMAPEVFNHESYDNAVDVFSFAMILYEMLEGKPPFTNLEPYEAAKYVAEGHRPTFRSKGYTPELRELTSCCWDADMNKRPTFLVILRRLEMIKELRQTRKPLKFLFAS